MPHPAERTPLVHGWRSQNQPLQASKVGQQRPKGPVCELLRASDLQTTNLQWSPEWEIHEKARQGFDADRKVVVVVIQGSAKAVKGAAGEYDASGGTVIVQFARGWGEDVPREATAVRVR